MSKNQASDYKPQNKLRIVTAASLFDGHDAAINIMRKIIQSYGVEVIHLGHNRSVNEIVNCAIQEDAQAIALTSYQGGHVEYLEYMFRLLGEKGSSQIKIFAGGGGTILPSEIKRLEEFGITKIYHPDDGSRMGLNGMIEDLLQRCDSKTGTRVADTDLLKKQDARTIAGLISKAENCYEEKLFESLAHQAKSIATPILGITGTGGAGKSSIIDEFASRFLAEFSDKKLAIVCVDPTKKKTGGALLGDRIRMNAIDNERVYMRSMATRKANQSHSDHIQDTVNILKVAGFDLIILESSGIGQSDSSITAYADYCLYIMSPEYGAASQLEKIDMLDFADIIAINKSDRQGSQDALRDVRKQYRRNHQLFDLSDEQVPVYATIASKFNNAGMNRLYAGIINKIYDLDHPTTDPKPMDENSDPSAIIPIHKGRYLEEVVGAIRTYNQESEEQSKLAENLYGLSIAKKILKSEDKKDKKAYKKIKKTYSKIKKNLIPQNREFLKKWKDLRDRYQKEIYTYKVRNTELNVPTTTTSLSGISIARVSLPKYRSWGDLLHWSHQENLPGYFPYTAGIFPFKREGEDPTRMFAGEGGPERTNKRFHYLSQGMPAIRLSTAFDSVTLYGMDPGTRPDIYGKIGNSGVSICSLDDMKKLFSGFDLILPSTSVSMTINGPAPMILGFYFNAAIDQQCEKYILANGLQSAVEEKIRSRFSDAGITRPRYKSELPEGNNGLGLMLLGITGDQVLDINVYNQIKDDTLSKIRGTVQADILKEDQAQNTCIFSTEFALKLMGDVQDYFIAKQIRNFYSVSISGYHIAEAGANPVTQLAFTLANGFTYVEYYLSRGMDINDFGPNLSFFFSNGLDPEYSVIGRVARRIWAKAMKYKYKADERSQKLKYHIQTSGRSLHSKEIDFNDIRTTLQALYAIYDNCNSLHTNAFDEAITTPTEDSVRRAMAIQLIINKELGQAKNENPTQGSFIIEELTDLVEEAVLVEFARLNSRGGVLGAMETMYQRSKIQDESMYYENLKHSGELPIIGVNTFLGKNANISDTPGNIIRASDAEKDDQIQDCESFVQSNRAEVSAHLQELAKAAIDNKNIFEVMIQTSKYCTLGQMTEALFKVGGQYRRNM